MAVLLFSFLVVVLSSVPPGGWGCGADARGKTALVDVVPDVCGPYARGGTRLPDRTGEPARSGTAVRHERTTGS